MANPMEPCEGCRQRPCVCTTVSLPRAETARTCCATERGQVHRACAETGTNEFGVTMCACKPFGRVHAYEPGGSCNPTRVVPALVFPPGGESDG